MSGRTDYEAKDEDPGLDTVRALVEEKKACVTKVSGARNVVEIKIKMLKLGGQLLAAAASSRCDARPLEGLSLNLENHNSSSPLVTICSRSARRTMIFVMNI